MNASRARLSIALLFLSCIVGCQQPPPPPAEGPSPDPEVMADKIKQVKMVASGRNTELTYKATTTGELYVVDAKTGQHVYNGPLAAGEKFDFFPASSRAMIDKQTVDLIRGTNEDDEYQIYFLPQ